MSDLSIALMILVPGAITLLLRAFPFLLFGGKRKMPEVVRYLGRVLPAAIVACLVIYCLKDIPGLGIIKSLPVLLAVAAVVILHLWKHNVLLSVFGGTVLYMLLLRLMG